MNQKKPIAQELKKKLKRQDFLFQDGWFQQLHRKPGQLHMQQFQISDCQQCKIYLFDASACVYIDQCKYCWIFIGPCDSSIFIRDCVGITIIGASRQFRVRDSSYCKISLYCQSQPIIESSHHLQFDCFPDWGYKQMHDHFQKCKMSPWNNHWYDIYDFTPKAGNFQITKFTNEELKPQKYMEALKRNNLQPETQMIPRCLGKVDRDLIDLNVIIFNQIPKFTSGPSFLESRISLLPDSLAFKYKQKIGGRKVVLFLKIFKQAKGHWKNIKNVLDIIQNEQTLKVLEEQVFVPFRDEH